MVDSYSPGLKRRVENVDHWQGCCVAATHRNNLTPLDRLRPKNVRIIDNSKDERSLVKYLGIHDPCQHESLLGDKFILKGTSRASPLRGPVSEPTLLQVIEEESNTFDETSCYPYDLHLQNIYNRRLYYFNKIL